VRVQTSFSAVGIVVALALSDAGLRKPVALDAQAPIPQVPTCVSKSNLFEKVVTYEFFGAHAEAAGHSLRQRLLVTHDYSGQRRAFTGQTDWHIEWRACLESVPLAQIETARERVSREAAREISGLEHSFNSARKEGALGCRIGGIVAGVHVTYTLPRWADRNAAPLRLRERWDRYIESLAAHERGHGAIAQRVADLIQEALVGRISGAGCDSLTAEAGSVVEEIMQRGETMQREYDRATGHGSAQGARFPF
jgi:predicted secreted Zn-dependent protease